jgi:GR25 family glycosyltransferase involved in LPS biosynthesis
MLTALTSFGPAGYDLYGRRFVETFRHFWPSDIQLICAWEGEPPDRNLCGFDLTASDPARAFLARHRTDPIVHGLFDGKPAIWSTKAKREGYSLRHDAYKFARKVFAICRTAQLVEHGKLFWLDADIVTTAPVTSTFLHQLLPDSVSLCYLNRQPYAHSELGFVGYNLERSEVVHFLAAYESIYATDEFMLLQNWDDCNVFDHLVRLLNPVTLPIPHHSRNQPFDYSPLAACMIHLKGKRKTNVSIKEAERIFKTNARHHA